LRAGDRAPGTRLIAGTTGAPGRGRAASSRELSRSSLVPWPMPPQGAWSMTPPSGARHRASAPPPRARDRAGGAQSALPACRPRHRRPGAPRAGASRGVLSTEPGEGGDSNAAEAWVAALEDRAAEVPSGAAATEDWASVKALLADRWRHVDADGPGGRAIAGRSRRR
jgi:hypothetical protein